AAPADQRPARPRGGGLGGPGGRRRGRGGPPVVRGVIRNPVRRNGRRAAEAHRPAPEKERLPGPCGGIGEAARLHRRQQPPAVRRGVVGKADGRKRRGLAALRRTRPADDEQLASIPDGGRPPSRRPPPAPPPPPLPSPLVTR